MNIWIDGLRPAPGSTEPGTGAGPREALVALLARQMPLLRRLEQDHAQLLLIDGRGNGRLPLQGAAEQALLASIRQRLRRDRDAIFQARSGRLAVLVALPGEQFAEYLRESQRHWQRCMYGVDVRLGKVAVGHAQLREVGNRPTSWLGLADQRLRADRQSLGLPRIDPAAPLERRLH
jgi:hypothetical protein